MFENNDPQSRFDFSENPTEAVKQEEVIVIDGVQPLEEQPAQKPFTFASPTILQREVAEQPQSPEESKITAEQVVDSKFAQRERGREIIVNLKTGIAGQVNKIKGFFGKIADRSRGIVNSVQQRSNQTIGGFVEKSQEYVGDKLAEGLGAGEQGIKGAIETSVQIGKKGSECLNRHVDRVQKASETLAGNVSNTVKEHRRVSDERKIDQRFSSPFNEAMTSFQEITQEAATEGVRAKQVFVEAISRTTDPQKVRELNQAFYDDEAERTRRVVWASERVTEKREEIRNAVQQAKQRLAPQQLLNSY